MDCCAHFIPEQPCCARGVNYQALAGGGAFTVALRLPCYDLTNRRGEQAKPCEHHTDNKEPS